MTVCLLFEFLTLCNTYRAECIWLWKAWQAAGKGVNRDGGSEANTESSFCYASLITKSTQCEES